MLKLTPHQLCDLELILNGGFAPLAGFLTRDDYHQVVDHCRLNNGQVWPIPITLDISQKIAETITLNQTLYLLDGEGAKIATMLVTDLWMPDKTREAEKVFGTTELAHPGVHYLLQQAGDVYIGGPVELIQMPKHYDFIQYRQTPALLKSYFNKNQLQPVIGFQTRNPMHRVHQELTLRAIKKLNGHLLIHPVVGLTKPGDIDYFTRVKCYQKILAYYPQKTVSLNLLPLAMRMAGPREALWHALIRKNYGCTHFIIGRDHAGPGKNKLGQDFYEPYAAQSFVEKYQNEIGIEILNFEEMLYVKSKNIYLTEAEIKKGLAIQAADIGKISGTAFRQCLGNGGNIPSWFSYPEIIAEIRKTYKPKHERGLTLFFTGLSGAGKSTIANALMAKLMELTDRSISLLDGDLVRNHLLSNNLGFSKEDRDTNIKRIGFVASEITKHHGIAICASIAPYAETREQVRKMVMEYGHFIEIFISTPLSTCEARDTKGLYQKVRAGEIKNFTGIDDPYEAPTHPDLNIDTSDCAVQDCVEKIIEKLQKKGYLFIAHSLVESL